MPSSSACSTARRTREPRFFVIEETVVDYAGFFQRRRAVASLFLVESISTFSSGRPRNVLEGKSAASIVMCTCFSGCLSTRTALFGLWSSLGLPSMKCVVKLIVMGLKKLIMLRNCLVHDSQRPGYEVNGMNLFLQPFFYVLNYFFCS